MEEQTFIGMTNKMTTIKILSVAAVLATAWLPSAGESWTETMASRRPTVPEKKLKAATSAVRNVTAFERAKAVAALTLPFEIPSDAVWTQLVAAASEDLCECRIKLADGTMQRFAVYGQYGNPVPYYWTGSGYATKSFATKDEAIAAATNFVAQSVCAKLKSYELAWSEDVLGRDEVMVCEKSREISIPFERFRIVFVDERPRANWQHPCRYVFVAEDMSAFAVSFGMMPPRIIRKTDKSRIYLKSPILTDGPEDMESVKKTVYAQAGEMSKNSLTYSGDASHSYFVIVSGGADPENNGIRFWADAAMFYSTLTKKYCIPRDHIKVFISDGTDAAADANLYNVYSPSLVSSPTDLDGDGTVDVNGPAKWSSVQEAFSALASSLTASDRLFVFITSHGGPIGTEGTSNWDCKAYLYSQTGDDRDDEGNATFFTDDELATWTKDFKCPVAFAIETCYSGGFIDNIKASASTTAARTIATACNHYESSWGMIGAGTWGMLGEGQTRAHNYWIGQVNVAFRGCQPKNMNNYSAYVWQDGTSVNADSDSDGRVSMLEAKVYAYDNDYTCCTNATHSIVTCTREHPQFDEYPPGSGANFHLVDTASSGSSGLMSLSISGLHDVRSGSATYGCTAFYATGATATVTPTWSIVSGSAYASVSSGGILTALDSTCPHVVTLQALYTDGGVTRTATKDVTVCGSITIADALDCTNLTFTTGGASKWFGQATNTHDGVDALQSGALCNNKTNWVETTVAGPGTISFWWNVSSEGTYYDYLFFSIDGTSMCRIGGVSCSWVKRSYSLGTGTHALRWTYCKNASISSGTDAGFLDQVAWTPEYYVTYAPGSNGTGYRQTVRKAHDVTLTLKGAIFARDGYTQTGWATKDGGTKAYSLGGSYSTNAEITLYPVWTRNTYTITYNPGTYGTGATQAVTKTFEVPLTLKGAIYARSGYAQTGWSSSDGGTLVYTLRGSYTNNNSATLYPTWGVIESSAALDNYKLSVNCGGSSSWYGQNSFTHDGIDAMRSGPLSNSQTNWLSTTVSGTGTLSFWWYVSSEQGWDFLEFMIDGSVVKAISGTTNIWRQVEQTIVGSGTHTVQWRYRKDYSGSYGLDAGFIDQVVWTPDADEEGFVSISHFEDIAAGTSVTTGTCEPSNDNASHWYASSDTSTSAKVDAYTASGTTYSETCGQPYGLTGCGDNYLTIKTIFGNPLWRTVNPLTDNMVDPRPVDESLTFDFIARMTVCDEVPSLESMTTVPNLRVFCPGSVFLIDDKLAVFMLEEYDENGNPTATNLCVQAGMINSTSGKIEDGIRKLEISGIETEKWNRISVMAIATDGHLRFFVYFNGTLISDEPFYARPQTDSDLSITAMGFDGMGYIDNIVISERDPIFATFEPPDSLTATASTSVKLSWSPVSGATSYTVWRAEENDSTKAVQIATVTGSLYSDSQANCFKTYYYWVKAVNGNEASDFSEYASGHRYDANTFLLKYDANGGEGTMTNEIRSTKNYQCLTKNAYTRSGYAFMGWGKMSTGSVWYLDQHDALVSTTSGSIETLYAIWGQCDEQGLVVEGNIVKGWANVGTTDIVIPNGVTTVNVYALTGKEITSVIFPDSLKYVYGYAFSGCPNLTNVVCGAGLKQIYNSAFKGCSSLESITLSTNLLVIGTYAFQSSGLRKLDVPSSVTNICSDALSSCISLTNLTLRGRVDTTHASNKWGSDLDNSKIWVMEADAEYWESVFGTGLNILDRNPGIGAVMEISGSTGGTAYLMTMEQGGKMFVIDESWFTEAGIDISDGVSLSLMNAVGANGLPRYQSFLFGLEPESTVPAAEQLKATIAFNDDGTTVISCDPKRESSLVTYTTLGKTSLGSTEWVEVTDANRSSMRFFKVNVNLK